MTIGIRTFYLQMTIFLEYDKESLLKTLEYLQEFYNISGLHVTEILNETPSDIGARLNAQMA